MKRSVTACLVVRDPHQLAWLGDKPVLRWCLRQLDEVRGLGQVSICVAPALRARLSSCVPGAIDVVPFPAAKGDDDAVRAALLDSVISPVANRPDDHAVLVWYPAHPFLPAARIEACTEPVRAGRAAVTLLARRVDAVVRNGVLDRGATGYSVPVAGLAVYRLARLRSGPPSKVEVIEAGTIEALDVSDPDECRIIRALAQG